MSRRGLTLGLALISMACGALSASAAGGGHSGGSAPAPPPSSPPHSSGSLPRNTGAAPRGSGGGGSAARSNTRSSGASQSAAYTRNMIPNRGVNTAVQPNWNRAGGVLPSGVSAHSAKGAAAIAKAHEFRWACEGANGVYYYTYGGPCPEVPRSSARTGSPAVAQNNGFQNGTDYATDPWSVGLGPSAGRPREDELPILTNQSEKVAPYAVILRDGMALASVDRPKQQGNMIIARDRGGNLYSVRATEVDMGATKPQAAPKP